MMRKKTNRPRKNHSSIGSEMTQETLVETLNKIGDVFKVLEKLDPSPEISQVSLKLSEAGMWARMAHDTQKITQHKPTLEIKPRENKFYKKEPGPSPL